MYQDPPRSKRGSEESHIHGCKWEPEQEYDPECYGWEKSRLLDRQQRHSMEVGEELGSTSMSHHARDRRDNLPS